MLKKNSIILSVIAVAVLLIAVTGASFAYFSVTGGNTSATTNVNVLTPNIGVVGTTGSKSLTLNVSAKQMTLANQGKKYYAVEGTESEVTSQTSAPNITLATMTVNGGDTKYNYNCSGTLTITLGEDIKPALASKSLFFEMASSSGITITDLNSPLDLADLKESGSVTKDFTYNLTGADNGKSKNLVGNVYFQNNGLGENGEYGDGDQKAMADKNINVTITVTTTSCTVS